MVDVRLHQVSALSPYLLRILVKVLTEGWGKNYQNPWCLRDDILLCGDKEVDMTEYLETRKSLQERGWGLAGRKVSLWISLLNRVNKDIETRGTTGESYSFQIPRDEYRRRMWYGHRHHKKQVGTGCRNWKKCNGVGLLCERRMPAKGLQNSDQASNHAWGRNVGHNEETRKTDLVRNVLIMLRYMSGCHTQRQDHIRGNREWHGRPKISPSDDWSVEERWRTHTEESVENGYTRVNEERTTENKMENADHIVYKKNMTIAWTEALWLAWPDFWPKLA